MPEPTRPRQRGLTQTQKDKILEHLGEVQARSGRRPWMVVIRQVDGVIQVYEARPPERIDAT